jgi:hypothetical protein
MLTIYAVLHDVRPQQAMQHSDSTFCKQSRVILLVSLHVRCMYVMRL